MRIAPGAQRDELRRDPVHPDAQGPLDPDGDARVTRYLVHDRLQLLVIENELTLRPGQSLGEVLLGDEFFGCARLLARFRVATAAAALVALAAIAPVYYYRSLPAEETGYFATKIGESRVVALADGSAVTLNTNSIIEQDFAFTDFVIHFQRQRYMTGRAQTKI